MEETANADLIFDILCACAISSASAASLRGELGPPETLAFGKVGGEIMGPLPRETTVRRGPMVACHGDTGLGMMAYPDSGLRSARHPV